MSEQDAYAQAGVSTTGADTAVGALVAVLGTIDTGKPSLAQLRSGHYANVLKVAENLGVAVSTDGVGSKVIIAEQLGKFDTVGIDCMAMNVNDLICVGATPIALVDYIAARTRQTPAEQRLRAETATLPPETVAPPTGEVSETLGAVVSRVGTGTGVPPMAQKRPCEAL